MISSVGEGHFDREGKYLKQVTGDYHLGSNYILQSALARNQHLGINFSVAYGNNNKEVFAKLIIMRTLLSFYSL